MIRTTIFLCSFLSLAWAYSDTAARQRPDEYTASIQYRGSQVCAGTIIDKHHIVAAGSCMTTLLLDFERLSHTKVLTGTINVHSGGDLHDILNVWPHEKYTRISTLLPNPYDIAVVRVNGTLQGTPLSLPTIDVADGEYLDGVSWSEEGILYQLWGKVDTKGKCSVDDGEQGPSPQFCFSPDLTGGSPSDGTEPCLQLTLGAGIISQGSYELVGLVPSDRPCPAGPSGRVINVFSYVDWIQDKISQGSSASSLNIGGSHGI